MARLLAVLVISEELSAGAGKGVFLNEHRRSGFGKRFSVQSGVQDGLDAPVAGIAEVKRPGASGLQAFSSDRLLQAQNGLYGA